MEVIQMNSKILNILRKISEDYALKVKYPIYLEYAKENNGNNTVVVTLDRGKCIEYFTHMEVIIPDNRVCDVKLITKPNDTRITIDDIRNAHNASNDILDIIGEMLNSNKNNWFGKGCTHQQYIFEKDDINERGDSCINLLS